jgi:LmbE family N-acetylglucosaminyl deacetylase
VKQLLLWGAKEPNYFSDISETFDMKMAALRCHHSQVGHRPPEWEQRVRKRYQDLAKDRGFSAAEAFFRIEFMR